MLRLLSGAILSLLVWQWDLGVDAACKKQEYASGSLCCQNCPAGTYMMAPCTAEGELGTCQECDDGTFMEHANGEQRCFPCRPCRPDQEVVAACTHTRKTECRCGPGRFCDPDQPCELCKKCARCGGDEEVVRNCTPTANTECKKVQSTSAPPAVDPAVMALLSLLAIILIIAAVGFCVWKRCRGTASQSSSAEQKPGQDVHGGGGDGGALGQRWSGLMDTCQLVRTFRHSEEERQVLRDSCTSSTSNSQYSLTGLASCPSPAALPPPPRPPSWVSAIPAPASTPASLFSPLLPIRGPDAPLGAPGAPADEEPFPLLVPVKGEESLRRCFDYFEELDVDYHRKFFRRLNINDNVIKGKEELPFEDRLHELLHIWMEKEGRGASLNHLLQVLLDLNQRRTAENIKEQALHHGHYLCEG